MKLTKETWKSIIKILLEAFIAIAICIAGGFGVSIMCTSCNVTRHISNTAEYYQRGDTSVVITTKTIETYNANKVLPK